MKNRLILLAVVPAIFALNACMVVVDGDKRGRSTQGSSWERIEQANRDAIARLDIGRSLNSVLSDMGTPEFDEKLALTSGAYRVLYYRTHRVASDGMTTRDECTPLVFRDGELIGWGESQVKVLLLPADSLT